MKNLNFPMAFRGGIEGVMMKCMRGICYGKMDAEGGGAGGGDYECWPLPFCVELCFPCWVCRFCVGHADLLEMEAVKIISVKK